MTIFTLENEPGAVKLYGENASPWTAAAMHAHLAAKDTPPQNWQTHGLVAAYINHSRWVVMCPYCNSAAMASKVHREFFCIQCRMAANDHHPLEVIFPDNASEIEAMLIVRPILTNRNWRPGETVEQLRRENEAHL